MPRGMMIATPARPKFSLAALALACGLATGLALASTSARAQEKPKLSIVRDAEIEQLLRDYARPIFKAAGLNATRTRIVLINDRAFNAFVVDGKRVFVNTGTVIDSATPNEVICVLAHEAGHIADGHLVRRAEVLNRAKYISIIGTLLGAGAAIGGARSGQVSGNAGGALTLGPSVAQRMLLSYQRGEEQAADRAGLRFLAMTHQSAAGFLTTFKRFSDQQLFLRSRVDPYLQSHPLAPERIAGVERLARESPYFNKKDPPALQQRHDLARAKLIGFTGSADEIARRYPMRETGLPAQYARAIAAYRFGRIDDAQRQIDALIRQQPRNAYFWELKGQSLLENARAQQAVAPLRKAVSLSHGQPLIRMLLGQALLSTDARHADEALRELSVALQADPDAMEGYRFLAQAYAIKGNEPMAALVTAKGYAEAGNKLAAAQVAKRAQAGLPRNSPGWRQADDIIHLAKPEKD